MKKNKTFSLFVPLLVLAALVACAIAVSSYIKTLSDNMSKANKVIDTNFHAYHNFSLSYFNNSLSSALNALAYIDNLAAANSDKDVDITSQEYSQALSNNDTPIAPDNITVFSTSDIKEILSLSKKGTDKYTAYSSFLDAKHPKSCLFYDRDSNRDGFFILYPIRESYYSGDSTKEKSVLCAFYQRDNFIKLFLDNNSLADCVYSIFTTNNNYVFSYNSVTGKTSSVNYKDSITDDMRKIYIDSLDEMKANIRHSQAGSFNITDSNDDTEYYVYYNPLKNGSCNILNMYAYTSIQNNSGLDYSLIPNMSSKGTYIQAILLLVFILIAIIFILLSYYHSKNQVKYNSTLLLEKERYKAIVENSYWDIWEYDFTTDSISKISKNEEPLLLPQFRQRYIRDKRVLIDDIMTFSQLCDDISSGKKEFKTELRLLTPDGKYEWYELIGSTIFDNGKPVTSIVRSHNIDSQKKEFEAVKNSSERDVLTRLYNLNAVRNHMTNILDDHTSSFMHALLIIDIDNFIAVKDKFGQMFGDAVLLDFASKLSNLITSSDIAGRIGGDKFIVFLHNVPYLSYPDEIAQKILSLFNDFDYGENITYTITCSIGISIYPNHGDSFETLISAADIALYHSKKSGKNQFTIYSEELATTSTGHDFATLASIENDSKSNHTLIDNDIVYSVVEMLFESKDLNASLIMAFSLIGNYYGFDQVGIVEYSQTEQLASCNYFWFSSAFERFAHNNTCVSLDVDKTLAFFLNTENGVYYTSSLDSINIPATSLSDVVKCAGITSIIQIALYDNGVLKGYLFAHSIERIEWAEHIIDSISLLSKIIGGYLIKQRAQENAYRMTQVDILTGCDNLFTFINNTSIISTGNPTQQYATIYMDIDNFKFVNERYGYSVGDTLLIDLSQILRENLKDGEALGHVDADKFVLFIKFMGISDFDKRIVTLFKTIIEHTKELIGDKINLIAGVYLSRNETNLSAAVDRANIARKSIKDHHRSTYEIFNESMKSSLVVKNDIENAMEGALERGEFKIYYQPKINVFTNEICGSEALVRWDRPGKGLQNPGVFIPVFEENGFIVELDLYVFEKVCQTLRKLMDNNVTVYPVSVNFSRVHLKNDLILNRLEATIKRYDIDPALIEVEITESALSEGDDFMPTLLNSIHHLGFKLSMDDFGCGLSSLNSLRKFPFDILKLDKDFFNSDGISEKEQIVIANVVNLAKQLNMDIIAEGIETKDQVEFLKSINSPIAQGFFYSRPLPENEFLKKYLNTEL